MYLCFSHRDLFACNFENLLAEREHRHCPFTQYIANHRWFSIGSRAMGSTSKETLTRFSMLLMNLFAFTSCEKISPVQIVPAYRHDVLNSSMHLRHTALFCRRLDMMVAEALTLDSCGRYFAI